MTDFDIAKVQELEHRTDDASAPEVFFTPVITPESLVVAYHALGAKTEGKVAMWPSLMSWPDEAVPSLKEWLSDATDD